MSMHSLFNESREFVIGRISAGSTYITGGVTTASGMAKAATQSGLAPSWLPSVSVDTAVLLIGALFTVLTGLVSIWAKRQDMRNKREERRQRERAEERERRAWVMDMLARHGEERMREMFGADWRDRDRSDDRVSACRGVGDA